MTVVLNVVFAVCALMLGVAGIMALIRAERGPTMLNRTLALDVFATVLIGESRWRRLLAAGLTPCRFLWRSHLWVLWGR